MIFGLLQIVATLLIFVMLCIKFPRTIVATVVDGIVMKIVLVAAHGPLADNHAVAGLIALIALISMAIISVAAIVFDFKAWGQ